MTQPLHDPGPGEILFIVGAKKVKFTAIRGLLTISSPVFRNMFEETKENTIELSNIDADAFKIALSHIRGNDVRKNINKKNMCNVLHISNKYSLQKLSLISAKFVKKSLDKSNIFQLYSFAQSLDDDNLKKLLWKWLGRKSIKITDPIITKIFQTLTNSEIAILLQKDYISIREERIFTHCLHWLKYQYKQKDKTKVLKNTPREMMNDFLQYIRFPLMNNKFLSNDVYFAGILTDKELINIFRAKTLRNKSLTVYNLSKRCKSHNIVDFIGNSDDELQYDKMITGDSDDDFDSINMDGSDDEEEKIEYKDITSKIKPILNSGECGGYPMQNMYIDGSNYWCSNTLASNADCWCMFDCGEYGIDINKIDLKFQASYACSIVKIYSSDEKRASRANWDKITKKINMPKGGNVHEIKIRNEDLQRYLLCSFEDWTNGYVGIERIHFYNCDE
eukprot:438753_1